MKINLHFIPEKPTESCEVVAFVKSKNTGDLLLVMSVSYSAKLEAFNAYDYMNPEKVSKAYNDDIVAWAYFGEVEQALIVDRYAAAKREYMPKHAKDGAK